MAAVLVVGCHRVAAPAWGYLWGYLSLYWPTLQGALVLPRFGLFLHLHFLSLLRVSLNLDLVCTTAARARDRHDPRLSQTAPSAARSTNALGCEVTQPRRGNKLHYGHARRVSASTEPVSLFHASCPMALQSQSSSMSPRWRPWGSSHHSLIEPQERLPADPHPQFTRRTSDALGTCTCPPSLSASSSTVEKLCRYESP